MLKLRCSIPRNRNFSGEKTFFGFKRKGQQSCSISNSIQAEWDKVITYQKGTPFKRYALRKRSNKHQNLQKALPKADKKIQIPNNIKSREKYLFGFISNLAKLKTFPVIFPV